MKDFQGSVSEAMLDSEMGYESGALVKSASPTPSIYLALGKRVLDVFIVLSTLVLTLPVIVVCACIVAVDGNWPFFGHKRVGANGREFLCWKIRSMAAGSEERLQAYLDENQEARVEWETTRKLRIDPRVTWFGTFLRKSSLDELPQIFNVLLGEMSIVGPRPVVREELALYGRNRRTYLAIRPGITGLWQVSGRNDVAYHDRVAFDQEYLETISLKRDLTIILKTFKVLVVRNGH